MAESLYDVLGVPPTATEEEIKAGLRSKAKQCHPDVHKGEDAVVRYKQVQHAFDVLMDAERRKRYDETGDAEESQANNFDSEVIALIHRTMHSLVSAAFEHGHNPAKLEFLSELVAHIENQRDDIKRGIALLEKLEKTLPALSGRFKPRKGVDRNLLKEIMEAPLKQFKESMLKGQYNLKVAEEAIRLCKQHTFEVDRGKATYGGVQYGVKNFQFWGQ